MTPRFNNFIPFVLKWECDWPADQTGQLSRDPQDPGGTTRWGIDAASHPGVNVVNLTYAQALGIYFDEWTKDGIESMAPKLGEVFFNACVNCGIARSNTILHQASPGGYTDFLDYQESFYHRLATARPSLGKFLKGWLNRTQDLRKFLEK